jgi:biopolymer transport protein ExbB/TolQ
VLRGGWAMLLIIPMSVVALAAILRAAAAYRREQIAGEAREKTSVTRVTARLAALREQFSAITAEDVRSEITRELLELYSLLQPLPAIFILAPIVGAAGSITRLMVTMLAIGRGGSVERLSLAVEAALVPLFWGVVVAGFAYLGWALLKARLFYCERYYLRPAIEEAAQSFRGPAPLRRRENGPPREAS